MVWMTALIAVVSVFAIALVVAIVMYVWAHAVPPLEAEATSEGLRLQVNRAVLRDVEISVDSGAIVALKELPRGVTVLPWSDFGLVDSGTLPDDVRQVHATGMSRLSRFETSISFIPPSQDGDVISAATAQTLNYVSTAE